jgi:hypothetical protein
VQGFSDTFMMLGVVLVLAGLAILLTSKSKAIIRWGWRPLAILQ